MPRAKKAPVGQVRSTPKDPIEWEQRIGLRPSSLAWRATLKAFYCSPLDEEETEMFLQLSGGVEPPERILKELLVIAGRRGGKSDQIARLAVYECIHGGHGVALAPGQVAIFAVISPLRDQSQQILNYARGICAMPAVRDMVLDEPTAHEIRFTTGVALRIMTCDAIALSGPTVVGAVLDEFAKYPSEADKAAMPDTEVLAALRPAMTPPRGAPPRRLIGISSAYTKDGLAYKTDQENFGKDNPKASGAVLVVRGDSTTFNPTVDQDYLDEQRKILGERVYMREFCCVWQDSVSDAFFPAEVIDQCIDKGRYSSPPKDGIDYWLCADPAWKVDNFTLAAVHRERRGDGPLITVVDRVWAWSPEKGRPLSTEVILAKIAAIARQHDCHVVYSDQASGQAISDYAKRFGLTFKETPWTAGVGFNSKTSKYRKVATAMADGLVRLPDDEELLREFYQIGSTLRKDGSEDIGARKTGLHDDRVSACVMAITVAMEKEPDFYRGGENKSDYQVLCEQARKHMDPQEIRELDRMEEANNHRLGFGSGEVEWDRLRTWRY